MPPYSGGPFGSQYSANAWPEPEQELVAERTTASGTIMRAHMIRNEIDPSAMFGQIPTDGWDPAGWCYPIATLRVGVTTPTSTNIVWASLYSEPRGGVAVTTFATGYVEGSPMFGIVAQVADDVEGVAFTTAGGLSDVAEPAGGIAMLRASQSLNRGESPTTSRTPSRIVAYVDDDTGLVSAWNALHDGQYGEAALTATADIDELVFTSPGEAWFRYDVETSIANFPNRYGIARLDDEGV